MPSSLADQPPLGFVGADIECSVVGLAGAGSARAVARGLKSQERVRLARDVADRDAGSAPRCEGVGDATTRVGGIAVQLGKQATNCSSLGGSEHRILSVLSSEADEVGVDDQAVRARIGVSGLGLLGSLLRRLGDHESVRLGILVRFLVCFTCLLWGTISPGSPGQLVRGGGTISPGCNVRRGD